MKYCQHCAARLVHQVPDGDDKLRYCCTACNTVFYQNPNNIVGTLPWHEDRVLLCRRAIEPRKGKWTLPAGFMENGETTLDGAVRETTEEAGAEIIITEDSLYTLYNLPHINQVYWFFRAQLAGLDFEPGHESLEVKLFREDEIPWEELAFTVIRSTLQYYFADLKQGRFPVRLCDVHHDSDWTPRVSLVSSTEPGTPQS